MPFKRSSNRSSSQSSSRPEAEPLISEGSGSSDEGEVTRVNEEDDGRVQPQNIAFSIKRDQQNLSITLGVHHVEIRKTNKAMQDIYEHYQALLKTLSHHIAARGSSENQSSLVFFSGRRL